MRFASFFSGGFITVIIGQNEIDKDHTSAVENINPFFHVKISEWIKSRDVFLAYSFLIFVVIKMLKLHI